MATTRDQNEGQNNNIKIENKSFDRAGQLKNGGITPTNLNSIQEEIKKRFSPRMLPIIWCRSLCLLYGCKTWSDI
jgi:hypothetical protein